jgi:DNA-binding CsgD family transcriptional regulator
LLDFLLLFKMLKHWLNQLACMLFAFATVQGQHAHVQRGHLDLRQWDWKQTPTLELAGDWHMDAAGMDKGYVQVPGSWDAEASNPLPRFGKFSYELQVLLGEERPADLTLYIQEFLTAYTISVNGVEMGGNGHPGDNRAATKPAFSPRYFLLPATRDTLDIRLTGANFHHRHSGLVISPQLGSAQTILSESQARTIWGGILIGLALMNGLYQFMLCFHRRAAMAHLLQGIVSWILGLHFLCLNQRWLYVWAGESAWEWVYRLELFSLVVTAVLSIQFFWVFLNRLFPLWLHLGVHIVLGCLAAFVLFSPIHAAAEIDRLIPAMVVLVIVYLITLTGYALVRKERDAIPLLLANLLFAAGVLMDSFLAGAHVSQLHTLHYLIAGYFFSMSWILSQRTSQAFAKVSALSAALEKANQELEQQNKWLEEEVAQRTRALTEAQAKTHQLELAQKKRDLEALSANHTRKVQLTRNLIEELQKLTQQAGDPQSGLRNLISNLRGQLSTEDKLEVLQADFDQVNAEFFERLQVQCPGLSKTEREICAYLKLNLSSKDIAALRNTSLNTINVTRHRIRKKLGLERDEELEAFVQQV